MASRKKNNCTSTQMSNIKDPHSNDVLFGRGGGTNHHPGNKRYRELVEERKLQYVNSERLDKPMVAVEIVRIVRQQRPPGRFLRHDGITWNDVGDKEARKKVSQALREGAATIRDQQDKEQPKKSASLKIESKRKPAEVKSTKRKEETAGTDKNTFAAKVLDQKHASVPHGGLYPDNTPEYIRPKDTEIPLRTTSTLLDSDVVKSAPTPPMPRPMTAKRATSHEYESIETKRDLKGLSVKRAALSKDKSPISNTLKKKFIPDNTSRSSTDSEEDEGPDSRSDLPPLYPGMRVSSGTSDAESDTDPRQSSLADNAKRQGEDGADCSERGDFDCDREMRRLSNTFEQTTLNGFIAPARQLSNEDRMRDMDVLYVELSNDAIIG